MEVRYFKEWSRELDRDMEFKVYGNRGKVCFAFPPQNGRFWDFENFGMVECMRPWIEEGRIMLVCADGIDGESWSAKDDSPRHRIEMQEKWFRYITLELYPRVQELGDVHGKGMLTGCSMGAVHSGIFFFRRPDLFDTVVALSGTYNANDFPPCISCPVCPLTTRIWSFTARASSSSAWARGPGRTSCWPGHAPWTPSAGRRLSRPGSTTGAST